MLHTKCDHHLTLPQWDRIDDRGLDFLDHHCIARLDETDLRCRLDRDHPRQFQIMNLLFKTVTLILKILRCLRILRQIACLCLRYCVCKFICPHLCQFFLSGQNVHGKLFEI